MNKLHLLGTILSSGIIGKVWLHRLSFRYEFGFISSRRREALSDHITMVSGGHCSACGEASFGTKMTKLMHKKR